MAAVVPHSEVSAQRLHAAIDAAIHGSVELPGEFRGPLPVQFRRWQENVPRPRGLNTHRFDDREIDVLRLLAAGLSVTDIGPKLSYSERTVKNVLHAILPGMGLHKPTPVVAYATRAGVI